MVETSLVAGVSSSNLAGSTLASNEPLLNASSQARFEQAMDKNTDIEPEKFVADCNKSNGGQCMGDKMLDNFQQLKNSYDKTVDAINETVNNIEITPQGLLKLQMEIAKLQMQEELMAKTASKSTQNVDTLLKSQ